MDSVQTDFTLSPYTGWTREHWKNILAELTYGYVLAAEKQGSYARALYGDDRRDLPDAVDALEAFARMASAWGAWLSNPRNPATLEFNGRELNLEEILASALLDGTNADNVHTYWGDMYDMSQHIVEAADVALTLWLSRERVFNRMSQAQRDQIIHWLEQVDDKDVYYDNWILFPVLPMTVRRLLGYAVDVADLDTRLDQMAAFYRSDGWYADGPGAEYELYNAWMFGWHYLLWAHLDGARRPEYSDRVMQRGRSFLAGFAHFFGANGSYTAWGRSIVYRFAAVSCFAAGYVLNIAPFSPGMLRRLSSGCIKYFYEHGCIDSATHTLSQGFHGNFPPASEAYISPGSPYWACHGLFALCLNADDPFWTETEEPLPVERGDFELALPTPGFLLSGRKETGQVFLLNAGAGHLPENPRHNYVSKYGKFAYSTHFPFNVLTAGHTYAPDAMISLTQDDKAYAHRFVTRAHGAAPGFVWSEFLEVVEGEPQLMRVAILMWRGIQLRLTYIQPTRKVRVVEAPGALGCEGAAVVTRRSDRAQGWEYAQAEGRALAIQRLVGYDDQRVSEPFRGYSNINLAYAYAEQPMISESRLSMRSRVLASAVLLEPAPFEPEKVFAGIEVSATQYGNFRVALPGGERAFVSLANDLPANVEVNQFRAKGDAVRLVRVNSDSSWVVAMGIGSIAGVCELDANGTVQMQRDAEGATRLVTDVGTRIDGAWLGGSTTRVDAQTLSGEWVDVMGACGENYVPSAVVREWARCNERTLVEFRVTV